jgi:hypothetical protein
LVWRFEDQPKPRDRRLQWINSTHKENEMNAKVIAELKKKGLFGPGLEFTRQEISFADAALFIWGAEMTARKIIEMRVNAMRG